MGKPIFQLDFHLRKPYNEAKNLIDVFNQIINEGGRCEICLSPLSKEGFVLQLKMYRCRNSYTATSLGARIIDNLTKEDYLKISKFNFASIYSSPVHFSLEDPDDDKHGPKISISLFEHEDSDIQNNINQQFKVIDLCD